MRLSCSHIRSGSFLLLLTALPLSLALGQEQPASLPPIDPNVTVTEAQKAADEAVAKRVADLDTKIGELEKQLAAAKNTTERISILEQRVQLAESRALLERTRTLGRARPKYTNGFKLLNDIETKSSGLVAAGYSVGALNAVSGLTDLREYSGFQQSFSKLVSKIGNRDEKSWLRGLVEAAIPKVAPALASLGAFTPLVGPAGFALSQLRNILPAFAQDKLDGKELKDNYTQLMCGIEAVSKLHDDLSTLTLKNAQWTRDMEALQKRLPSELSHYRALLGFEKGAISDAMFYSTAEKRFNDQLSVSADSLLTFMDEVDEHIAEFELMARTYHASATQHLEYWAGLKQAVMARREMACIQTDENTRKRFDGAIAQIDTAAAKLKDAYMFLDRKPEYEYYRIVTATRFDEVD